LDLPDLPGLLDLPGLPGLCRRLWSDKQVGKPADKPVDKPVDKLLALVDNLELAGKRNCRTYIRYFL
jgi:hypothetical protein